MNSLNENNDITTRDVIVIATMLSVVLLTLIGIVWSFDETVCENIWQAVSQGKSAIIFRELWGRML